MNRRLDRPPSPEIRERLDAGRRTVVAADLPVAQVRAVRPMATWIGSSGGVSPVLMIASTFARVSAR
jgi:hypothetical protein